MKYFSLLVLNFIIVFSFSQVDEKSKANTAIKSMCGCFDVKFQFAETFSYSEDSIYQPSKNKTAGALEWAQLVQDSDDKIVIQHLLIVGDEDNPMIIKHWRQDWLYQNNNFYEFNHDRKWNYIELSDNDIEEQWTQKVYQVDDSPRYEGSGTWLHIGNNNFWENTTSAPLPRREYTKRSDYNVTLRSNRHQIIDKGWVHDQDNKKIIRKEGEHDFILAEEKGYNTYTKVADSRCKAAKEWWLENQDYWSKVRNVWAGIYSLKTNLELADKIEGKRLYDVLFSMDIKSSEKKIKKAIDSYIVN